MKSESKWICEKKLKFQTGRELFQRWQAWVCVWCVGSTFAKGHLVHICETSVRMAVLNPVGLERIVYPLWSMNVLSKYKWLHKPCHTRIIVCLFESKIQKAVSEQPVRARMGRNFKATNVSLNSCKDELGAKKDRKRYAVRIQYGLDQRCLCRSSCRALSKFLSHLFVVFTPPPPLPPVTLYSPTRGAFHFASMSPLTSLTCISSLAPPSEDVSERCEGDMQGLWSWSHKNENSLLSEPAHDLVMPFCTAGSAIK